MKAVAGEMNEEREIYFQYGKLLLENAHPVLKEFLLQRKQMCENILEKMCREGRAEERTRERAQEIRREINQIQEALTYYDVQGNHGCS